MAGFMDEFGSFGFGSVDVVVTSTLPLTKREWFRKPRSKRRRIWRKWAKRAENWRVVIVPGSDMMSMGGVLYCSPAAYAKLQAQVAR